MNHGTLAVPAELDQVLYLVEGEQRIEVVRPWELVAQGRWALEFDALLSVAPSAFISERSRWCLIFSFIPSDDPVEIYPSATAGITVTFPHQLHNGEPEPDERWRTGKVCIDRPEATYHRDTWADRPPGTDRIIWSMGRLLLWIDAAAAGTLRRDGDPFEVPPTPNHSGYPVIGFDEPKGGLEAWHKAGVRWGGATLQTLPGALGNRVVAEFSDDRDNVVRKTDWGAWSASVDRNNTAVWILLDEIPLVEPWGLPTTWRQLNDVVGTLGVDLGEVLEFAGTRLRSRTRKKQEIALLLGFPAAERVGNPPDRVHWLALGPVPLRHRDSKANGFRSNEIARRKLDAALAKSPFKLDWMKSMNWSADQIRRRGPATQRVASAKIVLIGAGALGGAVAENLVRMGNLHMNILDAERVEVGNLVRHVLGLEAVGRNKAMALAAALNSSMIDAQAIGHATSFPPNDQGVIDALRAADVVIDCTGSDDVLRFMSGFEWGNEKVFVSLAVTWGAEGLLAFVASEASFPHHDAIERFQLAGAPVPDPQESTMEGIGCWHPIFPATAEDMRMWASIGSRVVRQAIEAPGRKFLYFRQRDDGQIRIERADV